jgi:hypothetical protein
LLIARIRNPGYLNEISFRLQQKLLGERSVDVHVSVMAPTLHEARTEFKRKTGSLLYFRRSLNGEYLMKYKKR